MKVINKITCHSTSELCFDRKKNKLIFENTFWGIFRVEQVWLGQTKTELRLGKLGKNTVTDIMSIAQAFSSPNFQDKAKF